MCPYKPEVQSSAFRLEIPPWSAAARRRFGPRRPWRRLADPNKACEFQLASLLRLDQSAAGPAHSKEERRSPRAKV
jgi:hypothetical protein